MRRAQNFISLRGILPSLLILGKALGQKGLIDGFAFQAMWPLKMTGRKIETMLTEKKKEIFVQLILYKNKLLLRSDNH